LTSGLREKALRTPLLKTHFLALVGDIDQIREQLAREPGNVELRELR
jgi:hypothetical protein